MFLLKYIFHYFLCPSWISTKSDLVKGTGKFKENKKDSATDTENETATGVEKNQKNVQSVGNKEDSSPLAKIETINPKKKMNKVRDLKMEKEDLTTKIKTKQSELSQLKSKSGSEPPPSRQLHQSLIASKGGPGSYPGADRLNMSQPHLQQLKAQIMAYRMLDRRQALPPQIVMAVQSRCQRKRRKKEDSSPLTKIDTNNSATKDEKKMNKVRDIKMEKEELTTKIKTKQRKLSQLKSKSEKDVAVLTEEVDTIENKLRAPVDKKLKAGEKMRRLQEEMQNLQEVIDNCDENISSIEKNKKTKENLIKRTLDNSKAAQDDLTEEIENLDSRIKTVDNLIKEEISNIRENIKRKREEIETEMDNLDELESQLEENKRGKLTGEYIEYDEPEIKEEDTEEDEVEKEELKVELSKEDSVRSIATDYDIKLEPTVKLEPSVPDT